QPIKDHLKGTLRIDFTSGSSSYGGFQSTPVWNIPSFQNVDVSAGLTGGRWGLTAYIRNVRDAKYWTGTVWGGYSSERGGLATFIPRTYGLRINYRFGGS